MLRAMRCFALLFLLALLNQAVHAELRLPLADGFDFPVGKPEAQNYYKARGLRLRYPVHFGEDWNGNRGGNSDLNDPIYTIADGIVTFAHDVRGGWGRVVLIRHPYRDPKSGRIEFVDSLYGHLRRMHVKVGQVVKRGQEIGTMGSNRGMYPAHLHFEIRHNLKIGMHRNSVARSLSNWADPTHFIRKHRRLRKEFRKHKIPTGTYKKYKGFAGL